MLDRFESPPELFRARYQPLERTIGLENTDEIQFAATEPTESEAAAWAELCKRVDVIDGEQVIPEGAGPVNPLFVS